MHMIDNHNYVVTVAIVDQYGELVQTRDFMRLLTPRKRAHPKDFDRSGKGGRGGESHHHADAEGGSKAPPKTEDEL